MTARQTPYAVMKRKNAHLFTGFSKFREGPYRRADVFWPLLIFTPFFFTLFASSFSSPQFIPFLF